MVREIVAAVAPPPVDPVLVTLGTGPLRPATPMGHLRGERSVPNLAEADPDEDLPLWKVRSPRVYWW